MMMHPVMGRLQAQWRRLPREAFTTPHNVCFFDLERRSPAFVGWDLYSFQYGMLIDTASSNELGI